MSLNIPQCKFLPTKVQIVGRNLPPQCKVGDSGAYMLRCKACPQKLMIMSWTAAFQASCAVIHLDYGRRQ